MTPEIKARIMEEARERGLAFVEDDFTEDGIYNPLVNKEEAQMWLLDILDTIDDNI